MGIRVASWRDYGVSVGVEKPTSPEAAERRRSLREKKDPTSECSNGFLVVVVKKVYKIEANKVTPTRLSPRVLMCGRGRNSQLRRKTHGNGDGTDGG